MTDFYLQINTSEIPDPIPAQSVKVAEYDDGTPRTAYLQASDLADPTPDWPASAVILAAWNDADEIGNGAIQFGQTYNGTTVEGVPTYPIQDNYWDFVRPLGNDSGQATGPLRVVRFQGHPEVRNAVDDESEYPATNAPFTLEIDRQDYGSTALPWDTNTVYSTGEFATSGGMWRSKQDGNQGNTPFGGSPFWEFINQSGPWGWLVKMISDDPLRDITARAISQHSATPCNDGNFLFTTGAFINDGKYGDVFYTECPPGNRDTVRQDVNFALRLGAGYEGWFVLPESGEDTDGLFWSADQ